MKLLGHKYKWTEVALFVALLLEFAFVVFVNLTKIPATLDNDSAKLFTHAIEIWNSKQIFIPTWVNETMLELDTALFFAVPIYGICKNIYIAFGLSNILILLIYYFFFASLLKRMKQSLAVRLVSCLLLTIPYSFGQLLYFDMMFFAGGFYGIKILLPLMLIWLMTTPNEERKAIFWIATAFATIFSFVFSVSTGPYSLLCGIAPVVLCYIWFAISEMKKGKELFSGWLFGIRNLILYAQGIAALAGIYVGSKMQVDSTGSTMEIIDNHRFIENAQFLLADFFEQMGAFPEHAVKIMSVKGISSFAHFVLALLALIALIGMVARYFKRLKHTDEVAESQLGAYYMVIVFLWNLLVLLVCEIMGGSRYLLMGLVPMVPLLVVFYRELVMRVQGIVQRGALHTVVACLVAVVALLSNYTVLADDCFPPMAFENQKYDEVIKILNNYPQKQVFLLNDMGMSEYLRVYDYKSGREYLAYMNNDGGVFVHDYYESRTDASFFAQDHLLLVDEYFGSIEELPEYLKNCYTEVDSYQNLTLYQADVNRMDGASGYASNEHSIDYCYTPGYEIKYGELTEDGSLLVDGNGEVCASSPWLSCAAKRIGVTLDYEVEEGNGEAGSLQIWDANAHELIAEQPLLAGEHSAAVDRFDLNGRDLAVQVVANNGARVLIKRFTYDRE